MGATGLTDPSYAAGRGGPAAEPPRRLPEAAFFLLAFLLFFALAVGLQLAGGAYGGEIGAWSDDSAHYVTGLMVRDYLAAGAPWPPIEFAKQYYLHYPRIGVGHWPPLFYALEGAWMLLVSPSTASVMVLMAVFTALFALLTCRAVKREFGRAAGIAAGAVLTCLPEMVRLSGAVMLDIPVALFAFWAVERWARFLHTGTLRDSAAFGAVASLALWTHGGAAFLAAVPPVAVLLQRRPRLYLRPAFWAAAVVVAVASGPWYAFAPGARHEYAGIPDFVGAPPSRVWWIAKQLPQMAGVTLALLALAGLATRVLWPIIRRRAVAPPWACAAGVLAGMAVLRFVLLPAGESRHLLALLPCVLMFAFAALWDLAAWIPVPAWPLRYRRFALALAATALTAFEVLPPPRQAPAVFAPIAADLLASPDLHAAAILVSSNSMLREGQFIAAVAMREKRPGRYLLRASKVLARVGMLGDGYRAVYQTPGALDEYLRSVPVSLVVLDGCPAQRQWPHQRMLAEALDRNTGDWRRVRSYPCPAHLGGGAHQIRVYRLNGRPVLRAPAIRLDMRNRLGEVLVNRQP